MKDLNDYRGMMRTILGDSNARRYADDQLDMGLSQALIILAKFLAVPESLRMRVLRYESGRAVLSGVLEPGERIESLFRASDGSLLSFSEERIEGNCRVRFYGLTVPPAAGEDLIAEISAGFGIRGLDGAVRTTVPDHLALSVAGGAAGYAALIRARSVTEVFGKRPEDVEKITAQGNALITLYERSLREESLRDSLNRSPWPERGFRA